jgi:hypothetical protein
MVPGIESFTGAPATRRAALAVTSDANTIHCGAYHIALNKILFSH